MSKKIYVGNLPFKYRGRELREVFSKFGEVEYATVILDRYKRDRSKGFGFVTFVNDADADKAIAEMNGKDLDGRDLTVNEAKPREGEETSEEKAVEEKPKEESPSEETPKEVVEEKPLDEKKPEEEAPETEENKEASE